MGYDRNIALNVARGELGYHEKNSNAYLDDKTANSGSGNYTKYARDLDALGYFYNGPKQGFPYCDVGYDWCLVKAYGVEAALELLCQPQRSAGAGCYYSAMYYKQRGQFYGPGTVPQPVDQIFFTYKPGEVSHTGMVESVSGSTITVIEFNTSDQVARRTYQVGDGSIYGYGRPNWGTAAEDINVPSKPAGETVYDGKTVTELAQEVIAGKWGIGAERVAALTAAGYDYTAVQSKVNEILSGKPATPAAAATQTPTPAAQNYTVARTVEETVFNFCRQVLGLNTAATCGALANIDKESGFQIGAIGDAGTSFGICQWHASRNTALRSWCGNNGKDYTTLDGQLWYMKHELETTHTATLNALKAAPDTQQGAYEAAKAWCIKFEVPADKEAKAEDRGNIARYTYWPKYTGKDPAAAAPATEIQTGTAAPATTGETYTIELPVLKEGMSGSAVKAAQTLLILHGYTCGRKFYNGSERADGGFGPITTEAVKKFQADNALTVDGEIGPQTMAALLK